MTLNILTCFDAEWIITREPNQSNITKTKLGTFTYNWHSVKGSVLLIWFGSLMIIPCGSKHIGIFS